MPATCWTHWLRAARNVDLRFDSFALMGNMRHIGSGELVQPEDVPALLDGFFAEGQRLQQPAPGAVEALARLRQSMDLVVLTNIPEAWRDIRVAMLHDLGLNVPVHANDGPKGRMVRDLAKDRTAVFVDDLPPHHSSALKHAPHVGRLHMVADQALRGLIPAAPDAHARIDDWPVAAPWIEEWMEQQR